MRVLFFLFFLNTWSVLGQVHADKPFWQDYAVKYYSDAPALSGVAADRNGTIQVLSGNGLLHTYDGRFLYPGTLVPEKRYRTVQTWKLAAITAYENQLVYLSDKAVFSQAWAGKVYAEHQLPGARVVAGGKDLTFLVSDGSALHLVKGPNVLWKGQLPADEVRQIRFRNGSFWVLGKKGLYVLSGEKLIRIASGEGFTAFDLTAKTAYVGTANGYLAVDLATKKATLQQKVPVTDITAVAIVDGKAWFGTSNGAFSLRADGKYDYYNGERWLPGNQVTAIAPGNGKSVLILTTAGLTELTFKQMTLHEKAQFFDQQVRSRHIRNGFNASLDGLQKGNLGMGYLADSDNDGLWTSMYLAGEIFRYAVTKEQDALQNCTESLDAMERLYTIHPVPGFPARSFERSGYISQLGDPERWQHAQQAGWDYKATTSSDEVIGHIFAFGAMAELVPSLKTRAVTLIDTLMSHILEHDMYLVDFDGKPTMWGKWNPEYVNGFPKNVGDRKLNSSNITAMLQTAYHFTKKEKYKKKALELMEKHGYLENLMRPMKEIGQAPEDADDHAKHMSEGWNHSDDEMYFVGYWGLFRYAFNDALKAKYKQSILDHWQAERPEKDGAWNIFTALTGTKTFDLAEAIWYLQEYPLDLIDWNISNSHRKDVEKLPANFRNQTIKEVLPPDETPIHRHNANLFSIDRKGGNGVSEHSAGDIWLLPYWMGRYLGVISAPTR